MRARSSLVAMLVLSLSACTGTIGEPGGSAGSGPGGQGGGPGGGPGGNGGGGIGGGGGGGSGGGGGGAEPEGIAWSTRFPRLTHAQWENTTRDLLRLDAATNLSRTFAPDPVTKFETSVAERKVSATLWTDYQEAAESLATTVARDPARMARILPAGLPTTAPERARAFVEAFGRRAFRRLLTADEITLYAALFQQGPTLLGGDALVSGVELTLRAMLQSPHFLYRIESSVRAQDGVVWLSGPEVASRLSYTLWNTMPSDELLAAALGGELDDAAGVGRWAAKMLADPRADATVRSFHEQLLRVSSFGTGAKDPTRFPTFKPELAPVLRDEARLFLEEVLVKRRGSVAEMLTAPYTFVNDQTAGFYGLPARFGTALTRVDLDPSRRSGILTQIGFLAKNGGLTQSDPIHRGVAINFNLLCVELNPPPNEIPPLPPEMAGQTNRQRVDDHTKTCGRGCHDTIINPVGFAFERYDAVGAWRDLDNGAAVDSTGSIVLDGKAVSYNGAVELVQLMAKSRQLHDCYARNWLEYVFGRPPAPPEAAAVRRLGDASLVGTPAHDLLASATGLMQFRARPATEGGSP